MRYSVSMDWKTIITDLRKAGLTQKEIANRAITSQGYISDLENGNRGTRLSFEIGQRLIRLHETYVGRQPIPDL